MQIHIRRRITTTIASMALVAAGVVVMPAAADASAAGVCGPGYGEVASVKIRGVQDGKPLTYGVAHLSRNSAGTYCTVTTRTFTSYKTYTAAWMKRVGDKSYKHDGGNYAKYAGPVYRSRLGGCIQYGGTVKSAAGKTLQKWETRGPSSCGGH